MGVIFNTIGIIGVALLIVAYFLLQHGKIRSDQLAYPTINLVGAVMHLISLYWAMNYASLIIELFWIAISIYGIWVVLKKRNLESRV